MAVLQVHNVIVINRALSSRFWLIPPGLNLDLAARTMAADRSSGRA